MAASSLVETFWFTTVPDFAECFQFQRGFQSSDRKVNVMRLNSSSPRNTSGRVATLLFLLTSVLALALVAYGQTTISTGSIVGTVTDASGAVVGGAKVSIINRSTSHTITSTTNSSGAFNSGALVPGDYVVRVESANCKTCETPVTLRVKVTSTRRTKGAGGESSEGDEGQPNAGGVNT